MERTEFLRIWNEMVGPIEQRHFPVVRVIESSGQGFEPELAEYAERYRKQTAPRQAMLFTHTARQVELALDRLGRAEWLYVRGVAMSAQHINASYFWADEYSRTCHPKAQPYIAAMVEQEAGILSRLPMAAFIQFIKGHGLGQRGDANLSGLTVNFSGLSLLFGGDRVLQELVKPTAEWSGGAVTLPDWITMTSADPLGFLHRGEELGKPVSVFPKKG